jgi:hypothetical protein
MQVLYFHLALIIFSMYSNIVYLHILTFFLSYDKLYFRLFVVKDG